MNTSAALARPRSAQKPRARSSFVGGMLPFIGVILFLITTVPQLIGGAAGEWQSTLVPNAIVYMIGVAGIGAGIAHIFFGRHISRTIGFATNPYEIEVGCADLAIGIAAVMAGSFSSDYWLAIILVSSIFRVGCGIGHIISIVRDRNFAINNTAILVIDFIVPVFLVCAYATWAR